MLHCLAKNPASKADSILKFLPEGVRSCFNGFIISPVPTNSLYFSPNFFIKETLLSDQSLFNLKQLALVLTNPNNVLADTYKSGILTEFNKPHMGLSIKDPNLDFMISSNITRDINVAQKYPHTAKSTILNIETPIINPNLGFNQNLDSQVTISTSPYGHNTPTHIKNIRIN